ncbi:54S ribosomal protein L3, mitochondrial [Smittium culicis]|uniref:Large ribosomal subunit protein mL44 n=1 Tax=Smittium culicis TaxID=133412 RepID=A0A1R1XSH2_9FUNG|nr:54S ribosomal protein L3, mitochondrial [Smittium culicis]
MKFIKLLQTSYPIKNIPLARSYAAKSVHRIQPNKVRTAPFTREGLSAFQSRLGLPFNNQSILESALSHSSAEEEGIEDNSKLIWLGKRAINLYVGEYIEAKYPNLPVDKMQDLLEYSSGVQALSSLARIFGLQFLIKWKAPEMFEDSKIGETKVLGKTVQALVGAIYQDLGKNEAKNFIYKHLLSLKMDISPIMQFNEPKRMLVALSKRRNIEKPVSRMLKETGRFTSSPVFIVGMFSGEHKIGEGFGSSIKMAEYRAAKDALIRYYGREEKEFSIPSSTEDPNFNSEYVPNNLRDTPAYL